uniref:Uncharacterized protein n=1 Tax=Anguilla anguilla TaxID=7936 RepID=A0A0E9QR41_ANGAN
MCLDFNPLGTKKPSGLGYQAPFKKGFYHKRRTSAHLIKENQFDAGNPWPLCLPSVLSLCFRAAKKNDRLIKRFLAAVG